MRNLKKILSLVLCMAMMLSVMVVGAGAAFSDQKQIKNTEAVDMCSALNIINGYTDGSFRPEGTITRAEACKMICIALNGGQDPVLGTSATATFTDIKGHWAEAYIEYCVSEGIVAGVGGGKFNPNGSVTGSQFAKMLLIAMGYRADAEEFLGNAWEVNVNVKASSKGLYEDLATMNPTVALTRDNAAQMVWNALNADMVKYDYKLSTVNGTLTSELVVEDIVGQTLLSKKYDANDYTGILTAITYNTKDEEYKYTTDKGIFTTEDDYTDLLGHNVTFVIKGSDTADVYGAYAEDSEVLVSGLIGDIDDLDDFNYGTDTTVEVDDVEYDIDTDAAAFQFVAGANKVVADANSSLSATAFKAVPAYTEFVAIDNDDDDSIDVIIVYPVSFGEVTYVGSDYVRVDNNVGKLDTDADDNEYTVYTGVAKEDYVLVSADTTLKTYGEISKLDQQTAKLNAVGSDGSVTLGDVEYDLALPANQSLTTTNLDKTVEFYAINGYVVDVDTTTTVDMSDYVMVTGVTGATASNGYYQADLLFTDGTTSTVSIANSNGDKGSLPTTLDKMAGSIWTYEIDGGKYELTAVTANTTTTGFDQVGFNCGWNASDSTSDANAKITINGGSYRIASDAVIFVVDGDDYYVKTGADLAKVTGSATVPYAGAEENSNGYTYVTFALVNTSSVSSSDDIYGFVTSDTVKTVKDSDGTYYTFTAWNGEENVTLKTVSVTGSDFTGVKPDTQDVIVYKVNDEGAVTSITKVTGDVTAITAYDGDKNIMLGGQDYEIDADDTTILFIDRDGKAGEKNGTINVADKADSTNTNSQLVTVGSDKYYANVQFVYANGTLELLVIDVTNDWYAIND